MKTSLYIVAWVEGLALMATELTGSRVLASGYGSGVMIWGVILAITLGGLATGYFLGAKWVSATTQPAGGLRNLSAALILYLALYDPLGFSLVSLADHWPMFPGLLLNGLFLFFVPLCAYGMYSPMLIRMLADDYQQAGQASGRIYGISTFGGIVGTFFFGLYLLPVFGIQTASLILAGGFLLNAFLLHGIKQKTLIRQDHKVG